MFELYVNRENTILDTVQAFYDAKLDFVLVGGYAVSAYKHRFSVDADVVIKKEDKHVLHSALKSCREILQE